MSFKQILLLITESKVTEDSLNKLLGKYGKVSSKPTANNKDIVFMVNVGSDEEKAGEILHKIQETTGRANTHLVTDTKTFFIQIYIPNSNYKSPKKEPLDQTDYMYGRTKHGEGGSLGS
jgi:hypothetical protein